MIHNRPLTEAECRHSARMNYAFNLVNGFAYICVGESFVQLFAVKIGCSDAVVASIGQMLFVGFLFLPLGRLLAARVGAAKTMGTFWVIRNFFALSLLLGAWFASRGNQTLASAIVVLGTLGFYGCRAGGMVVNQPLTGEYTTPETIGKILGNCTAFFYSSATLGLIYATSWVRMHAESLSSLCQVMVLGSVLGFIASIFIFCIQETETPRESARKPLLKDIRKILTLQPFRRLLAASIVLNILQMIIFPVPILILKRGFGASDFSALLCSVPMSVGAILGGLLTVRLARAIGPRRVMFWGVIALVSYTFAWTALPSSMTLGVLSFAIWSILFAVCGGLRPMFENSIAHYFISETPDDMRMTGSVVLYTCMGAIAGIVGVAISSALMNYLGRGGLTDAPGAVALGVYRKYLFAMVLFAIPAMYAVLRLTPLTAEKRAAIGGSAHRHHFRLNFHFHLHRHHHHG